MEVFVSLDHRFESTPDGHIWTISTYDYAFLKRYLDIFDKYSFDKKFYLPEEDRWVKLRVSAAGIRTINKKGLKNALNDAVKKGFIKSY